MPITRVSCFVLLAFLTLFGFTANAQFQCSGSAPSIGEAYTLGDGQGSYYYLVQVCALQPHTSVAINLLVQDVNTDEILFQGQAPTDVNGYAHFNVTSVSSGNSPDDQVFLTSPDDASLTYSTLTCFCYGFQSGLSGQYDFIFQGTIAKTSQPIQMIGAFVANGNGVITGGEADISSADGVLEKFPLAGAYSVNGTTGSGVLTLSTSLGAQTFQISLNEAHEGTFSTSNSGTLLGTGSFAPVNSNTVELGYGSYSTQFSGTLPCDFLCHLLGGSYPTVTGTGIFCFGCQPASQPGGEPTFSFTTDQIAAGLPTVGTTQGGVSGAPDSFRRMVLTDSGSGADRNPARYAVYFTGGYQIYYISLDRQGSQPLVSGTATQIAY